MNGAVQGFYGNERFLVRFQYGCKKGLTSDQLTIVIVEKIHMEKEAEVLIIPMIPDETVTSEKVYPPTIRMVLIGRRIRQTWTRILMRRIWRM